MGKAQAQGLPLTTWVTHMLKQVKTSIVLGLGNLGYSSCEGWKASTALGHGNSCTHARKTMKEPSTVEGRLPLVLGMGACSHALKQQKRGSTFCTTTLLFAMLE
jgi:hypothetical protein